MNTQKIVQFLKNEAVLCAALFLALISMIVVKPDREYLEYIDYRTLALLFCLMSLMAGFQKLGVFSRIGCTLLGMAKSGRQLAAILVGLCFFSSMLVTNDVALITFVPFAITVLQIAALEELLLPVVVLQTIAANLGSMLTPIGNPQNLYLYSQAGMGAGAFVLLMLPYSVLSLVLLALCLLKIRPTRIRSFTMTQENGPLDKKRVLLYTALFLLSVLAVARVLPWQALLVIVTVCLALADKGIFRQVDYSLLLTFCGFFVFIGNIGRLPAFGAMLGGMLTGREVLVSIGASQVISNVPAALLLSGFTKQYRELIIGTNLGGLGTLIASMASLISYKYIARCVPQQKGRYFGIFTLGNIAFLIGLGALYWALG